MKVVVFGASGSVGGLVVHEALAKGHEVTAFVRDASRLEVGGEAVGVVEGDVLDADAVQRAVAGQEAAVVALGARKGESQSVVSEGIANIVPAMEEAGVRRLVMLSTFGVGESMQHAGLARFILPRVMGEVLEDRLVAERTVRKSDLEWVIIRPARLTGGAATASPRIGEDLAAGLMASTRRSDVARFLVSQLTDDAHVGAAPSIVS